MIKAFINRVHRKTAIYNVEELETILDWVDVLGLMKVSLVYPEWQVQPLQNR